MAHHKTDAEYIERTHNTARFCTETRHISWVLLIAVTLWGVYGYYSMPQRKDPDIPVRVALAMCPWPGVAAEKMEQLVTRKIEEKMAENTKVKKITSSTRTGMSVVDVELIEKIGETGKEFDDIKLKLDSLQHLPEGAGPVIFVKDFGDTAALMLTVASPMIGEVEVSLRAKAIEQAIVKARSQAAFGDQGSRFTLVVCFPISMSPQALVGVEPFARFVQQEGLAKDVRIISGSGFVGIDGSSGAGDDAVRASLQKYIRERARASEIHPDTWEPVVIRDPKDTTAKLALAAGPKYTYRELDDFTNLMERTLLTVPQVAKVSRAGVQREAVYLEYSQERIASYGLPPAKLKEILQARNISMPGGQLEIEGVNVNVEPSGGFKSEREIGGVMVATAGTGTPVYLRDLVQVVRSYESPSTFLNFFSRGDAQGNWPQLRAITLAVQMKSGEKIGEFGKAVDAALDDVKGRLPEDLIMARTSDQPLQVAESIALFMSSLYEAIILVVIVSLIGFWEWRSALLMSFSIPLTLAMTYGLMHVLGIDLQQVSIASLILALGLLVDDPVVAGDAIKRELAAGQRPVHAAWLGPTKLATAIMYATITNIVAYLPFLFIGGDTGRFIYSLPVVMTCSLVASRIVSMTFIPLLGYYLLRPEKGPVKSNEDRRHGGFSGFYYKIGDFAIAHRWSVLLASFLFLGVGVYFGSILKTSFFPKDLSYLSYVDVWLPESAPLSATYEAATQTEKIIRQVSEEYGRKHPGKDGKSRPVLESLTTFVGGGGPRFWFSVSPEQEQQNYAQIIIQVKNKWDTINLVVPLQQAVSGAVPGARVDVRLLESGTPVGMSVGIRVSGEDILTLRNLAAQVKTILETTPGSSRVRDNWGVEGMVVRLNIDPDRANLAGISNQDVAAASSVGMNGYPMDVLREGDKQIPIMARLRMEERARLSDLRNLYVFSSQGPQKVPLALISKLDYQMQTEQIERRNQFRTVTISCDTVPEVLASQVMNAARPRLMEFQKSLPPGYNLQIGGEEEEQSKGFNDLTIVLIISVTCIYLALVFQFRNAIKPLIVFASIPYGVTGALAALVIMGAPFGFMAFLGIVSLVGVIVSHVIVLFDFIEEKHAEGEPLREAVLDAGMVRLRPVMITVGATVIALVPLAMNGGPLWEPLCYTQFGGLIVATFITLLLVPVIFSICVLDLRIIKWDIEDEPA
ncbi:MAG: efflux RND transporter permease subunit [Deltaproteobacteria bacterium]|nr:efflux RND transporter permease subunit [Deltaproteobacteria bacterium]